MRRMGGGGQKLGSTHVDMLIHWQLHHLLMEMRDGSGRVASHSDAKRRILDRLQAFEGGSGGIGGPDGSRIVNRRLNQSLKGS